LALLQEEVVTLTATKTRPQVDTKQVVAHPEHVPARPTREAVITAIMGTTGETRAHAEQYLTWCEDIVTAGRRNGYKPHIVPQAYLTNHIHAMMSVISPDKAVARPGSTHAKIEALVLDPTRGEAALIHDQVYDHVTHCAVIIRTTVVR
jgi:hypothetical protein